MSHYITGISKDPSGNIDGYQLENGELLSKSDAIDMAKQGLIKYVIISVSETGEEYLRSLPDEYSINNLDNLSNVLDNKIDNLPVIQ